jgi:hypothetical protein
MYAGGLGERRQRGPDVEDVAGEAAALAVADLLARVFAQARFELALQQPHATLELLAVAGVLEDLPRPEQLLADGQAGLAELTLDAAAFGVEGEVALQVRPADLSLLDRQMAIGPPAIGRHDRVAEGQQLFGVVFVTIGAICKTA